MHTDPQTAGQTAGQTARQLARQLQTAADNAAREPVVLPHAACACGRDSCASRELTPVPTMAKTAWESKHMVRNGTMEKVAKHLAIEALLFHGEPMDPFAPHARIE